MSEETAPSPLVTQVVDLRSILVPLDGSRLAEAATGPALALALRTGATVTLLHVLEHEAPERVHGEPHLSNQADAQAYLARVAERFATAGVTVETHVHENPERDVSWSLVAHAEELGVDLIVLAAHGSSGIRGFLFGRVAEQVLRRGSRPMLLVQVGESEAPPAEFTCSTVAVLLNGSAEAEHALPIAVPVARAFGASLHLIAAVPTLTTVTSDRLPSTMLMPSTARAVLDLEYNNLVSYLSRVAGELRQHELTVTFAVVRGDPASATVDEAERVQADLLAFATHGRTGLSGIWAGSVGAKVLARFKRPLLLARVPE